MINNIFIFIVALFFVIKGATLATKYSAELAESYNLSKYTVGFIIVAVISILPETFISINAAIEGIPSFGLGMLFGSNIADLTLLFALIIFLTNRGLKVESKILTNHVIYPFILLFPIILGLDGFYSRIEGITLIIIGIIFYYIALRKDIDGRVPLEKNINRYKYLLYLLGSMAILLTGSHFVVTSATAIAIEVGISPILIGILVVGLGTTIPEFLFSYKSAKKMDDSLAVGDILGTVLADATIVIGILALIDPFSFSTKIIYVTGMFMLVASIILFHFMTSGKVITKKEAKLLFIFWIIFILVEFVANSF